jgi:hypothetical protein
MNNPRLASPKQKALITYLGHESPETATSKEASAFINMAIEDETYQDFWERWKIDKIKLHPDLYPDEVEFQKKWRFSTIFSYCETRREALYAIAPSNWPLKKLNLKACEKAVEWLDNGYAGWDLELFDSSQFKGINEKVIETYFVPAIANVAPDFIRKERSENPTPIRKESCSKPNPNQIFQTNSDESPPPIPVQKEPVQKSKKKSYEPATKKKKRGCLFWFLVIILVWFGWNFLAAIFK